MQRSTKGFTLWFTGLPCSGKSTLAQLVAQDLAARGQAVEVLDGDAVRSSLTRDLGFSKHDRDENIRRIGFVCQLLSKHGITAISAAISPYRAARDQVRASIASFVEIYVKASLEACMQRDVKGLYKKALAGELINFTGIDDPYEAPLSPELVIETEQEEPTASAVRIVRKLEQMSLIPPAPEPAYTREEAEQIRARLIRLGYIEP
ncbi:MAG: adenylyl-sulfate kinase [Acidobacteria bacterium]|nr:adenylyl-sulfate kinase [Acidobacteriota bacterium]